jgi:two-component system, NtrC family, nitrogen regulation sensor histidine kinase NtrY
MDRQEEIIHRDRLRRKRRIRLIILACLLLIPALTYLETRVLQLGEVSFPVSGNVLIFVLINLNLLLLLLMVFLVLRNLVQLVFEHRRRFLGTRLRSKLVIAFVAMSFFPTGLLFFISLQFVSTSMDYWFNISVERSLEEAISVARNTYQEAQAQVGRQGRLIAAQLASPRHAPLAAADLDLFLAETMESHGLTGVEILSSQREVLARVQGGALSGLLLPEIPAEMVRRALAGVREQVSIDTVPAGELVRGVSPLVLADRQGEKGVLVLSLLIDRERVERLEVISSGYEGYKQLMLLKAPIKGSLLLLLIIVTLLIVFCAIWFAFYVARGLTEPMNRLAEATRRVAEGELDFVVEKTSGDEMGTLVDSFNRMTGDLAASKRELEEANRALRQSKQDADTRRRYMEIILENVAAGVISLDESGRITTINRFAEELLHIRRGVIEGRDYREILRQGHLQVLENFLAELALSGKSSIERPLRITIGEEALSLRVNFTRLEDEQGQPLGVVLVFDNLSELEKAQRMAAWREVARRIAHEVKNPLTPIQLSAQRLRKKYLHRLGGEEEVFDLCTRTIVSQVDELQKLVSEFSSFARMPAVRKEKNSLAAMAEDVLALFREAHREKEFRLVRQGELVAVPFDFVQMKRVLINLLDNAVAATGSDGRIEVVLACDPARKVASLEVCDNGPGVSDRDKPLLFEPYFSRKKSGTGLGLAIASTVVADHGGQIRVRDNEPRGARFLVELPMEDEG